MSATQTNKGNEKELREALAWLQAKFPGHEVMLILSDRIRVKEGDSHTIKAVNPQYVTNQFVYQLQPLLREIADSYPGMKDPG